MRKIFIPFVVMAAVLTACKPTAEKATTFQLPETEDIAMYQVNPRVFAPSNSLQAVANRIDSIHDLGVNVMWVMPIYPIGVERGKNSPYCIRDYKAVAPEFGTIEDMKNLADSCHSRGMALIVDWVANHTAWDNPWIEEHPDWYTKDEEGNIVPTRYEGQLWDDVADLNYDNQEMRLAMIDAMKFWIQKVGLDGFRCDVADGVPADFWQAAMDTLRHATDRRILMLAEGNRKDNFAAGFDMNYAWNYKGALVRVMRDGAPATHLIDVDAEEYDGVPAGKVKLRFITNHDQATEASTVQEFTNERGAMAAFVAATFLHGGALLYSSQEVAYPETINFFQYVPVDWTANSHIYKEYQALLGLYNGHPALRKGSLWPFANDDVLAFTRTTDEETLLIMVNVRNKDVTFALPEQFAGKEATNLTSGQSLTLTPDISLKPFEYMVFALTAE